MSGDEISRGLTKRLEGARGRLKNLYVANGLAHLALRLLFLATILFVLDYALALPAPVRAVLGILVLGYLAYSLYRLIIYPMTRPVTVRDMALAVENRYRNIDGRLISAVEMASLPDDRLMNRSRALIEASLDRSRHTFLSESWEGLFCTRSIRRAALVAAALLLVVAGYSAWQPLLAGIGLARMVGGSAHWPRRTTLLVHVEQEAFSLQGGGRHGSRSGGSPGDEGIQFRIVGEADPQGEQNVVVARGASLPLRIEIEGRDPGEVEIVQNRQAVAADGSAADGPAAAGRSSSFAGGGTFATTAVRRAKGDYRARIRDIRAPMTLFARGGDDDGSGRKVNVTVVPLPEITRSRAVYRFPEYLGLPEETRDSAGIEAPEGTRVDLEFSLTCPASRAVMTVTTGDTSESFPLVAAEGDPLVLRQTLLVESSGSYRVELWNETGFRNFDVPVHPIICCRDEDPRIKLLFPRRRELDVVPGAVIPFLAVAEDDYGIRRTGIEVKVAGSGVAQTLDFIGGDNDAPFGGKRIVSRHVMDLAARRFPFEEGRRRLTERDSVVYTLFACDTKPEEAGGRTETGTCVIDIVSASEKIRLLTERQIRLRREVKALLALQEEKRSRVAGALSDVSGEAGGEALTEQALLSLEMGQNQLTVRYAAVTREFASLFDEYLFNRIDRSTGAAALMERLLVLRRAVPPAETFEPTLYLPLMEEYEAGAFGDMDVMSRLLAMLEFSVGLSDRLSPEASGKLAAAVIAVDDNRKPLLLGEALALQDGMVEALKILLERMAEWEDFQELLQMMRDIVDDQDRINKRTREWIRR